jgi:hypothetical protein
MEATKHCPYCGEQILAVAIKCKHCGSDLTKPVGTSAEPARKEARTRGPFKIIGLLLLALVAWSFISSVYKGYTDRAAQVADASAMPPESRPVYKTTARALYKDYETNEVATDQKIGGAAVEVTGTIASIDKNFTDDAVINLVTGNEFSQAAMTLVNSQKAIAATLTKGQEIVIQCQKMARIVSSPQGTDCIISN